QKLNGSFLIRYIDSQIRERQNNYA
ncbi:transposase, partial [Streptococcus pneumoniae]